MFELSESFLSLLPDLALRLGVATLCGILLGIERERKDKPAGLRTITLITAGSALYMVVSTLIPLTVDQAQNVTQVDPSRIAAQVVTGIGFLGAGTIIQSGGSVHGLTTAAMIWVSAGIGLCVGAGFPLLGGGVTLLVLAALVLMAPFRTWLSRRSRGGTLTFLARADTLTLAHVRAELLVFDIADRDLRMEPIDGETLEVHVRHHAAGDSLTRLLNVLSHIDGVRGRPVSPS